MVSLNQYVMKKYLIIIIAFILVTTAVWYLFVSQQPSVSNDGDTPTTTFPAGGGLSTNSATLTIQTISGDNLEIHNFLNDSDIVKDAINDGYYYLGNHFSTNDQTPQSNPEYVIEYIAETNFFAIGLFREPLAQSRRNVEEYLMTKLGLSEEQMCSLNYSMSVPRRVNEHLAGTSFLFSFCDGSYPLE